MGVIDDTKAKMNTSLEHLKNDLKNIRTGRANPGLVDHVSVDVYGSHMRVRDIASVSCPDARQLVISPFDPQNIHAISKGIEKANLGLMPFVDGSVIRIKVPPLTEEIRLKMAKVCHEEREKTKVGIRNVRRDANEAIRKQKSESIIAEDEQKKLEKTIQDLTDKACKEADEIAEKKEKEISTI